MRDVEVHHDGGVGVLKQGAGCDVELAAADNPFPGPRPFESAEQLLFFGRAREISDIVALLSVHRTLLVPAPSGTGKTSLLQAGVIPSAKEEGFEILPIARVRQLGVSSRACTENDNIYVHNVLENWHAENPREGPEDATSLADFLSRRGNREGSPTGRILVFDQFEELFVLHPDRWRDRAGFFQQIQAALADDPLLHIVILLRDDYLARLELFTGLLRDCLRTRYPLHGLTLDEAIDAVTKPLATIGRTFRPGVAERLVQNLREVPPDSAEAIAYQGEYVEPVQLQIVCHMFAERLPADIREITEDHVNRYAEVTEALASFYARAVKAATKLQRPLREGKVRLWCEKELITPSRTRGTVYQGEKSTKGLANDVVAELERHRIIRSEPRGNALWYELTHDRFIDAVLDSNRRWFARHPRLGRRSTLVLLVSVLAVALASAFVTKEIIGRKRSPIDPTTIEGKIGVRPDATPLHGKRGQLITVFNYGDERHPDVELRDPDGKVAGEAHGAGVGPVLSNQLKDSGKYSIRVSGTSDQVGGDYYLSAVPQQVETNHKIKRGTHSGSIDQPNEVDVYRFYGEKGTLATISMTSRSIDPELILLMENKVVGWNDDFPGPYDLPENNFPHGLNTNSLVALTLPKAGWYEVRAFTDDITGTGSYNLKLALSDNSELSSGHEVRLAGGEVKAYTIRPLTEDIVSIRLSSRRPPAAAGLHLLRSDGHYLVQGDEQPTGEVPLSYPIHPDTGYVLVVTGDDPGGGGDRHAAGEYTLIEESLTASGLDDKVKHDELDRSQQQNVYRIDNDADTIGVMSLVGIRGDTSVRIVAPDGKTTQHHATDTDESHLAIPFTATGEYYAFVESSFGEKSSYSVYFGRIPKPRL